MLCRLKIYYGILQGLQFIRKPVTFAASMGAGRMV